MGLFDIFKTSKDGKDIAYLKNKYSKLINIILSWHANAKIIEYNSDFLVLRAVSLGASIEIIMKEKNHILSVDWYFESVVFGKFKLNWEFSETENQETIAQRIANDATYRSNIQRDALYNGNLG